jgi:uncharacterized protein YbjT (DUF2867 family)
VTVAVLGATGVVGTALVSVLAESEEVVAVSRRPDGSPGAGVRAVAADVTDATAVRRSLEGVDVAYYLVHSLGTPNYANVDRQAAETVAREAERAGVSQLVYLGGLGDDHPNLSPHLRSRLETGVALSSGAVPVTTLRAAVVIGRGSAAFETIVSLVDRLPAMIAPKWVATPTQPIALADVVRYLVEVARMPEARGQSFDVGGPDVLSYKEMIERIAHIRGRRRLVIEVPVLSPRLSSYWLHLVTPVRAGIARPLIEGLRNPTVVRNDRLRALLPFPLTSFDDAARAALSNGSAGGRLTDPVTPPE